jgi:uncharacterized protein (DUF362 family)
MLDDARVAVVRERPAYCSVAPFDPSESFPEWGVAPVGAEDNPAYRAVRELFIHLGMDRERFGTREWDPLGDLIHPGDTVVLKPNLVSHVNLGARAYGEEDTDSLVTHGSVIRVVLDYAARALKGSGRLIVGDCPIQDTEWESVVRLVGLDEIARSVRERFPGITVEVRDYRIGRAIVKNGVMLKRIVSEVREEDYLEVDLGRHSLLAPLFGDGAEFGVARYPRHRMRRAHTADRNLYLLPRDFLDADVMINLPKMKSHMKAGVTCALKNFVGLNGHKDYLPHFRYGSPKRGGDEYPDGNWLWDLMWYFRHQDWERDSGPVKMAFWAAGVACKELLPFLSRTPKQDAMLGGGSWHGNDTLWRTVLDINRAFFYYDRELQRVNPDLVPHRRYLAILDGLVGGHRESPLAPSPIASGYMLAARNPVAMDAVASALMRFDIAKLKQIDQAFRVEELPLARFRERDVQVYGGLDASSIEDIYRSGAGVAFEPSRGYRRHIEYRR